MPRLERAIVEHFGPRQGRARWLRYEDDAVARSPVVHFEYPSAERSSFDCFRREVMLELGSLTDQRPTGQHAVRAWVVDDFPDALPAFASSRSQLGEYMSFVSAFRMAGVAFGAAVESSDFQLRPHELGIAPAICVSESAWIEHHDIHHADGTGVDHVVLSRQCPKLGHECGSLLKASAAQSLQGAFIGIDVVHAAEAFKARALLNDLGLHMAPAFIVGWK
jgi:hypothetical protein